MAIRKDHELLQEPVVQAAIDTLTQSENINRHAVESLLLAYDDSRFLGRSAEYWVRTLRVELQYERAKNAAR